MKSDKKIKSLSSEIDKQKEKLEETISQIEPLETMIENDQISL